MVFNWDNLQGFLITGLTFNPRKDMVLRTVAGAGFHQAKIDGGIDYEYLRVRYSDKFKDDFPLLGEGYDLDGDALDMGFVGKQTITNIQGRVDYDWSLPNGFLFAAGVQELYSLWAAEQEGRFFVERAFPSSNPDMYLHFPVHMTSNIHNNMFNSSAYALLEYQTPGRRFGTELGLRLDHLYFIGRDFNIRTAPVLNPRLNLDFNVFKDLGIFESLDLTAGTGLFSSMNDAITAIEVNSGIDDFTLKPNRSWTSVAGIKTDFSGSWSFNIEGYFKYVFDRAYQYSFMRPGEDSVLVYRFNGDGRIWGFDMMLQKFESRYWDGWLSYTFTYARYHQPERPISGISTLTELEDSGWYYPIFHRFHNANLVLNFKPLQNFNIYTRLGLASGRLKPKVGEVKNYPVALLDSNGDEVKDSNGDPIIIQKWKRESEYDENSRTTWSIPLDVKFSYYIFNPKTKVQTEIYLGIENLLSLIYVAQANTSFNQYTGREDTGSDSANYEMPIPMVSFGFKWSY
jgi:hypothetical protein